MAVRRCVERINFVINFIFLNVVFMNLAITCNLQTISWAVNEQLGNSVL